MQHTEQWPPNDTAWVARLRGQQGPAQQRQSHEALAKYLYKVGYNYLLFRQNDMVVLASFADEDLAALAEDFVQDFLIKLMAHDFALLTKYKGAGPFTSFASVILRRMIAKELTKKSWTSREPRPLYDNESDYAIQTAHLESMMEQPDLSTALEQCMQTLSERERIVITRILVDGDGAQIVGQELGKSANAISITLSRAKTKLQDCLAGHGVTLP